MQECPHPTREDALLSGLQATPAGGGSETDTVFVYTDTCRGNGTDDGTVKRGLTEDTCSPLFEPPVVAWSFSTSLLGRCG